ncbi:hypothetical protein [Rhodobacter aestuarii]|nr:hypothetical protein [Rhodobacter aestuarii]
MSTHLNGFGKMGSDLFGNQLSTLDGGAGQIGLSDSEAFTQFAGITGIGAALVFLAAAAGGGGFAVVIGTGYAVIAGYTTYMAGQATDPPDAGIPPAGTGEPEPEPPEDGPDAGPNPPAGTDPDDDDETENGEPVPETDTSTTSDPDSSQTPSPNDDGAYGNRPLTYEEVMSQLAVEMDGLILPGLDTPQGSGGMSPGAAALGASMAQMIIQSLINPAPIEDAQAMAFDMAGLSDQDLAGEMLPDGDFGGLGNPPEPIADGPIIEDLADTIIVQSDAFDFLG